METKTPANARPWLVTGAAGFLGSHLAGQLLARGVPVIAVDDLSTGPRAHLDALRKSPAGFRFAHLDIRDTAALSAVVREERPRAVIHLAALHFIPAAIANPPLAVSLNVHGTQSVLHACRAGAEAGAAVEAFWFASTGDVYAPSEGPHREDGPTIPFNIYGLTKLAGEQLVALEAKTQTSARFVIGRLLNLYGTHETNPHILPEILAQLRRDPERPLRLGSLWPKRDLVPVEDAARAIIDMVERAPVGVTTCNLATGRASSMEEVISLIGELRGKPLKVETDPSKVRAVERPHLQADVSRLRALIGWTPHDDLRRGIRELLEAEGLLG